MKNSCIIFLTLLLSVFSFGQINKTDAKGLKQGVWEKKYPKSSILEYKGQFKDGKPIGTFTYMYSSNKLKAKVSHDEKTGRSVALMYHENGILSAQGIYKKGLKDSIWEYYMPSGRISTKETYLNDKLNGLTTIYYVPEVITDKSVKIVKTEMYKNGILDGEVKEFFDTGITKSSVKYIAGVKEGFKVTNHANGKPMMKEHFVKGVQHGWQFAYDESGKETNKLYFCFGKKLEGKKLDDRLKQCKAKGIDPNYK